MSTTPTSLKFKVYDDSDELIAEIIHNTNNTNNNEFSLSYIDEDQSKRPILLQSQTLTSDNLKYFLSRRVLPTNRVYVMEQLEQLNLKCEGHNTLVEMLKRNSGRVLTDDFYILVEENGRTFPKSNKTSISLIEF